MSMLSGPRRKQKVINLRAKNNDWSNDNTKFGQKMLEKMGWSAGKGLGAKENGIVEHVVAKYKNDDKGLGFEDKNDQWTKHEDDFNALLANLSNDGASEEKLHSGISLEDKSRKSKARVHYHKFTRGKDLSRYSEKDLANIFGKKAFKNEDPLEESEKEDIKTTEQKFTEKGSMEDYFKSKLAALKTKDKISVVNNAKNAENDESDFVFKGFSGATDEVHEEPTNQGFGFQSFAFYNTQTTIEDSNTNNSIKDDLNSEDKPKKKKKKNKKFLENCDNVASETHVDEIIPEQDQQQEIKKKKSKKKKHALPREIIFECEESLKKPKKKRKFSTSQVENTITEREITEDVHTVQVPKKKKKRKNKELNS